MGKSELPPILEKEREKTNHSLSAERNKTNVSLTKAREKVELRTDKFVEEERIEADQAISSARIEADAHRDIQKETLNARNEQKKNDELLENERRDADSLVKRERAQADLAIDKERDLKNVLLSDLVEKERDQTDKNLLGERIQTDSELHHNSSLLSDEIAEHSKTKISLTTRDEFLAIVSHDLRNPIGAISSCASILLDHSNYERMNPDEIKNWVELIKQSADTALRLISDILDMESIVGGKFQLKLESHNMDKIIRESLKSFTPAALAKRVFLRAVPSNIPGDIICDKDRILQVLSNLIGNALKFTPEGGSILLSTNLNDTEVKVSVCDTGPGIPEEKKEQIFERFTQLGSNDRRGLGLGLYISKMLIEAHQGRLWVQSKFGEGSIFYFTIPKQGPKYKKDAH